MWSGGLPLLCLSSAWIVSLSLLTVATLRILYHDGTYVLIWLNAFTRYVYLPAYVCLLFAAWQRRWRLQRSLVRLWSRAILPGSHPISCAIADSIRRLPQWPSSEPTIRRRSEFFFANVREVNEEYSSMLEEIAEANPDVIVLLEYGWGWHLAFKTSPVLAQYKYGSGHLQSHIGSVNVFSRLPLKTEMQSWVAGRPMHTIEVELGSQCGA